MSKIDDLIKELCPNGVEWNKLGEVCSNICSGGTPNSKNENYYGNEIPWLRTQEINFCDITDTGLKITQEGLNNSSAKWIPANCVIVAMYGATVGKIGINKIPLTTNQACCNLEINPKKALYKYVFYCLYNQYEYIKSLGEGSQTNINAQIVKNLEIPLPPLHIQEEIVRILDKFVEQQKLLEKLLELRKKQYEYYREELLTPKEGEEWETKTLGEVCHVLRGKRLTKAQLTDTGKYKVFHGGTEPIGFYNEKNRDSNTVMIINVGASAGTIGYSDEDFWSSDGCFCLSHTDFVLSKFIYYYLLNCTHIIVSKVRYAGIPTLDSKVVEDVEISFPSKDIQKRIVDSLISFEASITTLTSALEASKKRYEYYRDQLLNF